MTPDQCRVGVQRHPMFQRTTLAVVVSVSRGPKDNCNRGPPERALTRQAELTLQPEVQLSFRGSRRAEQRGIEGLAGRGVEIQAMAGEPEAVAEQLSVRPGAAHTRAEARIVIAAA